MDNVIRIGEISSVNPVTGMVRVVYQDKEGATTAEFPYFNHNKEYSMPKPKEMVLVLHISNDTSMGIVMGGMWNLEDKPPVPGENIYYKPLGTKGYMMHDGNLLRIHADDILFNTKFGDIKASEIIEMKRRIEILEARI